MKKGQLIWLLCWLATGSLLAQNAYWQGPVGPYGGNVNIVPITDSVVYAHQNNGLAFRSTDYGLHWTQLDIQTVEPGDLQLYYIGNAAGFYTLLFGVPTNTPNVYRSTDEGSTWTLLNNQIYLKKIWESRSGTLFGVNLQNHFVKSTDGGVTWQDQNLHPPGNFEDYEVTFGNNGIILVRKTYGKISYSLDDGQTWGIGGNSYTNMSLTGAGILFRMSIGPAFPLKRSTDWGLQWDSVGISLEQGEFPGAITELSSGRLILSTNRHFYFSDDEGISWAPYVVNTGIDIAYLQGIQLPNGVLLGILYDAIYRSDDEGHNWSFSAYGMKLAGTGQLDLLTDSLQLAFTQTGLWKTNNAGDTWDQLLESAVDYQTHPLGVINADSFAIAILPDKLLHTADGGQSFSAVTVSQPLLTNHLFATKSGRLFYNDTFGVAVSTDFGVTAQSIFPDERIVSLTENTQGMLFAIFSPLDVVNSGTSSVRKSGDGGLTWENMAVPEISTGFVKRIEVNGQHEIFVFGTNRKLAYSDDLGQTWTITTIPDFSEYEPVAVNHLGHIFVTSDTDKKILTSVDHGQTWYYLPEFGPILTDGLRCMEVSPSGYLYLMTAFTPNFRTSQSTEVGGYLKGQVLRDADADCSTPDAQDPLKNWPVKITGQQEFVVTSSTLGQYTFFGNPGPYEIRPQTVQELWWNPCDSLIQVQINSGFTTDSIDIAIVAVSECPLISVDVAVPQLRRCFDNTVYVSYCNSGSEPADSAWIDLELDAALSIVSTAQSYESLGNNMYRFQLGDINWGDCGQFTLVVHVDCNGTVLGQTHCISAHGFPDTLCTTVPEWSGATIEANATCQDTVVRLELRNTSNAPSTTLKYIIIEDDVVLFNGLRQYDGSEVMELEYPANGHTWRIESEQEPGHPFSNVALAFLEGCGGFQSLGFIDQFSVNGWTPSINQECVENTGAYDPNDKQGFPTGYGEAHRIRPGQALEYMIRFQNTGTDTAFTVQIRDTLSVWLDPASVRAGASSHPYTWNLSGQGILTFRFDHIMLPDSNVNLSGSQGFVSFWIDQRPEVPLETQILNTAAIYFDFNEAVITNQTLHTLGVDYLTSVQELESSLPSIEVQPNPASHEVLLTLPAGTSQVTLFDVLGKPQQQLQIKGSTVRMERGPLPSGVYWLSAHDRQGRAVGIGKVIWR